MLEQEGRNKHFLDKGGCLQKMVARAKGVDLEATLTRRLAKDREPLSFGSKLRGFPKDGNKKFHVDKIVTVD